MLLQAGEITTDGVLNVGQRLLPRRALGNAARERGTLGHEDAVLVRLDNDAEFHRSVGLCVGLEQGDGGMQAGDGLLLCPALSIAFGKLRAEGDEPLALSMNLRSDFEFHGKLLTSPSGKHNGCQNVVLLKERIVGENLFVAGPGAEEFENVLHAHPLPADARPAAALARLNRDALQQMGFAHGGLCAAKPVLRKAALHSDSHSAA